MIAILATESTDISLLVREILSETTENVIQVEGRFQRLKIIQSIAMESSLLQEVNEEVSKLRNHSNGER